MLKPIHPASPRTPPSPALHVDEDETRTAKPRLDRSPHPYHRQSLEIHDRYYTDRPYPSSSQLLPPNRSALTAAARRSSYQHETDYFDFDGRKKRKLTPSPSDSGTEADDERASVMKGLPAPALRPRKGLKDTRGSSIDQLSSPLLTPSCLDDEPRKRRDTRKSVKTVGEDRSGTDGESRQIREKYTRRRRAELVRRLLEVVSLALVTLMSVYGSGFDVRRELSGYTFLVIGLYLLYPIRLLRHRSGKTSQKGGRLPRLRIPVAYDPAPLLYPVFLPLCVVASMSTPDRDLLVVNLVLGICCLPVPVIPFGGFGYVHWSLSFLPYLLTKPEAIPGHESSLHSASGKIHSEQLVLLFPLHQTLVSCLAFTTTTSLLPTELQLLSVGLINLLLFSGSPQATILKGLLWIGGLLLFLSCLHVLRWAVELARVPSWRFRRPKAKPFRGNVIVSSMDDCLGGLLRKYQSSRNHHDSSDSDETRMLPIQNSRRKFSQMPRSQNDRSSSHDPISEVAIDTMKIEEPRQLDRSLMHANPEDSGLGKIRNRRHTLPTYTGDSSNKSLITNFNPQKKLRTLSIRPKSFLSLTSTQATILKWLYAFYVYLVVIVIIALPIRLYVGRQALFGNEPVGWALGYLFGDLPEFRLQVVIWNLENWICLPHRQELQPFRSSLAEHFRQITLGAANTRLMICAYFIANIVVGLTIVFRLSSIAEVDTRRKVFHGMMVVMFLPTIFLDPGFAALALALVLAIFLLLDLFRASQLPPVSKPLTYFLAPYVDGRDHRGPVIVSHIFLLVGCAIPLWLSLAATERTGTAPFEGWDFKTRDLSMVSGVVCVGMGDAAASLIGRRFGRRKWPWSGGKSFEGSLAFALAVVLGLSIARAWLLVGGWEGDSGDFWTLTLGKAAVAAAGASFTEAVLTGGNDNVVVPVILWLLVRALKI